MDLTLKATKTIQDRFTKYTHGKTLNWQNIFKYYQTNKMQLDVICKHMHRQNYLKKMF